MREQQSVTCIGAGVIGRSWAAAYAAGGCRVQLYDESAKAIEEARRFVEKAIGSISAPGLSGGAEAVLARIAYLDTLDRAVSDANYIQESIAEDLAKKRDLYVRLDKLCSAQTVIGSSTSSIPGSAFTEGLSIASRCIVAHPINPPHLIPLVEICPTPQSAPETVEWAMEFMRRAGREPILLRREIPGFIANRLQLALIGEALHLVGEGYCSATDLDRVIRRGLGLRWALQGPFEAGHLNADGGYYSYMSKFKKPMKTMIDDLKVDYEWTESLCQKIDDELSTRVPHDMIEESQRRRDIMLLRLRACIDASQAEVESGGTGRRGR